MEYIKCVLCGSEDYFQKIHEVSNRFNIKEKFQIQKCKCGMISLNPRVDLKKISKHYENENYHPQERKNIIFRTLYRFAQIINNRNKKKLIRKYISKKGAILDYGGGEGQFQEYMSTLGWKSDIYEPYLNNDINSFDEKENIREDYYDVISMFHVLEHIHNIEESLAIIRKSLKKEGILIISVPNYNAYERTFFNNQWIAYDAPRHLYHFTFNSIRKLLEKNKFRIINYKSMYLDTIYNIIMSSNKKLSSLMKIPYLIFISLICVLRDEKKASSMMIVCNKNDDI